MISHGFESLVCIRRQTNIYKESVLRYLGYVMIYIIIIFDVSISTHMSFAHGSEYWIAAGRVVWIELGIKEFFSC